MERVYGAPGIGQSLPGQGVDGLDRILEGGIPCGLPQSLGQCDDGGQVVADAVVEFGGDPCLATGGVALIGQLTLPLLCRQFGVAMTQQLTARPEGEGHSDHGRENEQ